MAKYSPRGSQSAALGFEAVPRAAQVSASIAVAIQERIASGAISVGDRLPTESELARDFAASRPSVREALAALQFVGLVESRRGYGTVVVSREPTVSGPTIPLGPRLGTLGDAVDLIEARLVLEPAAIASAALDPDRSALESARALIDGMAIAVDDPELGASTDIRVHHALLDVCRNALLRESARGMLERALDPLLVEARAHAWSSVNLRHDWASHHSAVYDAIEANDAEAARAAAETHLISVASSLALVVESEPDLLARVTRLQSSYGADPQPPLRLTSDRSAAENLS
jgi:DNA-binding FadR family transcriptional regulator